MGRRPRSAISRAWSVGGRLPRRADTSPKTTWAPQWLLHALAAALSGPASCWRTSRSSGEATTVLRPMARLRPGPRRAADRRRRAHSSALSGLCAELSPEAIAGRPPRPPQRIRRRQAPPISTPRLRVRPQNRVPVPRCANHNVYGPADAALTPHSSGVAAIRLFPAAGRSPRVCQRTRPAAATLIYATRACQPSALLAPVPCRASAFTSARAGRWTVVEDGARTCAPPTSMRSAARRGRLAGYLVGDVRTRSPRRHSRTNA